MADIVSLAGARWGNAKRFYPVPAGAVETPEVSCAGAFGARGGWAHGGRWDDSEAIPNGWPFLGQAAQVVKIDDLGTHFEPFLCRAAQVVKMDDSRAIGQIY